MCLPGLEMMLVAEEEEELDSDTQYHAVHMVPRGCQQTQGQFTRTERPPPKERTYLHRALYIACSLQQR